MGKREMSIDSGRLSRLLHFLVSNIIYSSASIAGNFQFWFVLFCFLLASQPKV